MGILECAPAGLIDVYVNREIIGGNEQAEKAGVKQRSTRNFALISLARLTGF
jgi:hypothetical protein